MADYSGYYYRLRAGSPMPTASAGDFVIHSFMAEYQIQNVSTCATVMLKSASFTGQGGGYSAANYSRIVSDGAVIYNTSESSDSKYIEERV